MPYSCRAYTLYGSPALQGWGDEYDRTNTENGNTALKQKNPAVEILLSIRRT